MVVMPRVLQVSVKVDLSFSSIANYSGLEQSEEAYKVAVEALDKAQLFIASIEQAVLGAKRPTTKDRAKASAARLKRVWAAVPRL